jgi:putative ABC transport system permease protein
VLTSLAIVISVGALIFGGTYFNGVFNGVLEDVRKLTGHFRIMHPNYEVKERMFSLTAKVGDYYALADRARGVEGVEAVSGRIRFGCLVERGGEIDPAVGMAIDFDNESKILEPGEMLVEGILVSTEPSAAVVGSEIKNTLGLQLGDTLTVITNSARGAMVGINLSVVGFFESPSPSMNKLFLMPLRTAQELLEMEDEVTEIVVSATSNRGLSRLRQRISSIEGVEGELVLRSWDDDLGVRQLISTINIVLVLLRGILLLIAGLGILNTMLMATMERTQETGVMAAVGMQPATIMRLFILEAMIIGVTGGLVGMGVGVLSGLYLERHGVVLGGVADQFTIPVRTVIKGDLNLWTVVVSYIMGIVVCALGALVPSIRASRMEPSDALRST